MECFHKDTTNPAHHLNTHIFPSTNNVTANKYQLFTPGLPDSLDNHKICLVYVAKIS